MDSKGAGRWGAQARGGWVRHAGSSACPPNLLHHAAGTASKLALNTSACAFSTWSSSTTEKGGWWLAAHSVRQKATLRMHGGAVCLGKGSGQGYLGCTEGLANWPGRAAGAMCHAEEPGQGAVHLQALTFQGGAVCLLGRASATSSDLIAACLPFHSYQPHAREGAPPHRPSCHTHTWS